MGSVRVGTSGWVYRDWRDRFYPPGLAQPCWLSYYAAHFDTVELNATTYRLPTESQIRRWCDLVPDAFRYTVKLSRLITHRRSMPERLDHFLHNYFQRASCFVPAKLAQVLVQFPPYLARDDTRLESFFDKLPPGYRYVVEFRHESWFAQPVRELLARRNIALCIHDYPGMRVPTWITSDTLAYVRFHGAVGLYVGSYSKRTLRRWASRLREFSTQVPEVYVYFNNDTLGAATQDAAALKTMLRFPIEQLTLNA